MKTGFATPLILTAVILAIVIGGGVMPAWRTTYLDPILPSAVREFLGRGQIPNKALF